MGKSDIMSKRRNKIDNENRRYEYYIDGNTVRKIEENPLIQERSNREQLKNRSIRRARENQKAMNFSSFCVMFIAVVIASMLCIRYLKAETLMETKIKNIEKIEKDLEKLTNENNAKEANINSSIELDEIFRTATGRLGMVYANKGQVVKYDRTESEYVRQYENIPSR